MAIGHTIRTGLFLAAALLFLAAAGAAPAQTGFQTLRPGWGGQTPADNAARPWTRRAADPVVGPLAIQNPRRIAGGLDGQLLVTDRQYNTVVAIDRQSLQPVWSAQLPEGSEPFGLAVRNRMVFVGDTGTQTVAVYRIRGFGGPETPLSFLRRIGPAGDVFSRMHPGGWPAAPGSGMPTNFARPIAIAVDGNLVFVLDGKSKTVSLFRENGRFVSSFEPRDGAGALLSPVSLAVDTLRREILVGDYGDPRPVPDCGFCGNSAAVPARILIYGYDGQLRFEIHGDGSTHASARFARIQGLAAGADGRIFAADPLGNRILVFDRVSGALLQELGTDGSLLLPLDVWLDGETGDLFVSNNRGARRIEVLRGVGGQP